MCVLGLLHSVYTYRTPLISQWEWLHSLKDARHGPEVSSTALLQLKGGQGTKPVILRGAGNDNWCICVDERSPVPVGMIGNTGMIHGISTASFDDWFCPSTVSRLFGVGVLILCCYVGTTCQYNLPSFEPHSNCDHECVQWSIGLIIHSRLTQVTMARPFRQMDWDWNCVVGRIWLFHSFIWPFLNAFGILKSFHLAVAVQHETAMKRRNPRLGKKFRDAQLSARIIWISANRQNPSCLIYGMWLLARVHSRWKLHHFMFTWILGFWFEAPTKLSWHERSYGWAEFMVFFFTRFFVSWRLLKWKQPKRVHFGLVFCLWYFLGANH